MQSFLSSKGYKKNPAGGGRRPLLCEPSTPAGSWVRKRCPRRRGRSFFIGAYFFNNSPRATSSAVSVPIKRNELDAIRRLLDELDVTEALITIDAIGCQHDVAAQVLEAGGDYVLQVKGNQPTLLQELEDSFPNISKGYTVNKEEGLEHGRIEHRQMKSVVLSPEMLG